MKRLEKEVQEQEQLLTGYQQENERLYKELKQIQAKEKASEARMFSENQKLGKKNVRLSMRFFLVKLWYVFFLLSSTRVCGLSWRRGKGEGEKTVVRTSRRTGGRHANWAARGVGTLPTPCLN